jgi:hypothetical protein
MSLLRPLLPILAVAILASAEARAEDTIYFVRGDVRDGGVSVVQGQRVIAGSEISTGPSSRAQLKFSDGMIVILDENTIFRVANYQYNPKDALGNGAYFDLKNGAVRITTGEIGRRTPNALALRTTPAAFSAQDGDYMVAIVNPAYFSVVSGSVAVRNTGGAVVFNQGFYGQVANAQKVGVAIREQDVPPQVKSAFLRLLEEQKAAAAVPAAEASSSGFSTSTLILLGVGAAALGMAGGGGGGGSSSTTSH